MIVGWSLAGAVTAKRMPPARICVRRRADCQPVRGRTRCVSCHDTSWAPPSARVLSYVGGNRKGDRMKISRLWWIRALLVLVLLLAMVLLLTQRRRHASAQSHRPDLAYLKAVNSVAPPTDPELLFVLSDEFAYDT